MDSSKGVETISIAEEAIGKTASVSSKWDWFGYKFPRQEVVYFSQAAIIYIVILFCLGNLSFGNGDSNLWVALLGSCIGYILPHPSMNDGSLLRHTSQQ